MSVATVYSALNASIRNGVIDLWEASAQAPLVPLRGVLALFGINQSYQLSSATLTQGIDRVTLTGSGTFGQPGDPQGMTFPVQGRLLYTQADGETGIFQLSLGVTSPGWTFSRFFNPQALPETQGKDPDGLGTVVWSPSCLLDLALDAPVFLADSRPEASLMLSGRLPANPVFGSALDMLAPWPLALSGSLLMPANWTDTPVMDLIARAAGSPALTVGSPATVGGGPAGLALSNLGLELIVRDDLDEALWGRTSFSVINLIGTVTLGKDTGALVANLYTPLLSVGPEWRLTAIFDPASASVVRGMAQLTTIFGLPALPLPDNFPLLETFKFREVDLTFTSPAGGGIPQLRTLAVTIGSEQQWSPPVPFVTLHDVGTRWVWGWGAIRSDGGAVRSTGTVSGSVFGTLRFGEGSDKVDIDVSVSLPELYIQGQMRQGDSIPIGQAFDYFFGSPGPAVGGLRAATITELGFAADPLAQNYSGETLVVFTDTDTEDEALVQGWAVDLVVITLVLEEVGFWITAQNGRIGGGLSGVFSFFPSAAPDDYESPRLVLSADYPVQDPEDPQGWLFAGHLYQGTHINLTDLVSQFLGLGLAPASVPTLMVDRLDVTFATGDQSYSLGGTISMRWTPELFGTPLKVSAAASIDIARVGNAPPDKPASGRLSGEFSINRIGIEVGMDVGVDEPTYLLKVYIDTFWVQAITAWRGEKGSTTNPRHQVVSVQLGGTTLGDMLEYLVNLAAPTIGFQLDSPWDVLKRIELSSFVLTLDPTNNQVEFVYRARVDLGFGSLTAIGVRYTRAGAGKVELILEGSLLGKSFTGDDALAWDVVNDPPPAVPGTGSALVDLRYLGIGQRIRLQNPPDTVAGSLDLLKQFMRPVENPNNLPGTTGPIAFSADSQWLIGVDIGLMAGTVDLGFLFNDPILYGLSVGLNGEKAGSLAGLRFEILYKKISDDVGMFRVELRLPDAFRTFQLGIASLTLGTVVVEVYTNGNFKVDLGFPYNQDFSRSFSVQAYIFIGRGGIYFGLLDGLTSSQVPRITNGTFSPVLELGIGLALGVGREIRAGILGGGAYVEVQVIFQGVLGWFNPSSAGLASAQYFRALGIAALHGKVYGYVDFKIIKVSISLEAYAQVSALFEVYRPTELTLRVSVTAQAKVKILFIKISFNFHVSLELAFTLGSKQQTPWIVAPGGDPVAFQSNGRLLGAPGRAGSLAAGVGPRARRNRSQRLVALRTQHLRHVLERQMQARALGDPVQSDWAWDPARALWPDGQPREALLHLLPSISIGALPVSWSGPAQAQAAPLYRAAFILCANSGVDPDATTARAEAKRTAQHHALAANADDTQSLTPDLWVRTLLLYALYAIPEGPRAEADPVTAGQLALLAAALDDRQTADTGFAWAKLDTLFATNLHLMLAADTGESTHELGGMVAPLPPGLTRSGTPGGTLNFADINPVGPWYEWDLAQYMGRYLPVGGASGPRPAVDDPAAYESYPTFIFRDYCLMIAKAAVQEAVDLMASATVTVADTGANTGQSLAQLSAEFPAAQIDYPVRAGDTVESVAEALGATSAELLFLNPDLEQQLASAPAGSRLVIALGIAPEVLAQDNAEAPFALDNVDLGTLLHQVANGETLAGIASLFNLPDATALFTGTDGDTALGASNALLDPNAAFDLPTRTWNNGPDTRLLAAATAYVRYNRPPLVPADWYAQAVFDGNRALISELTGDDLNVASQELPPGQVLQVPQGFNAVTPTIAYNTQPGDTLERIAATLALVQVYPQVSPPEAAGWQTFLAAVSETATATYGLPAATGLQATHGESLEALARRLLLDVSWSGDNNDPAKGTWRYAWPAILLWAGPAVFLAPLAVVPVPGAKAKPAAGAQLSFAAIASTYGLSVADAAERLAQLPGLYAVGSVLTVTQVPVTTVERILSDILGGEALPRIVNQGSRSLMAGLRAPTPITEDGHVVADLTQATPIYDLTGQQFDLAVDTDPSKAGDAALELTLTAQSTWITLVDSTISDGTSRLASAFLARAVAPVGMAVPTAVVESLTYTYTNTEIIAMGPAQTLNVPVSQGPAAMPLAGRSPRAHGLSQRIELQTPITLPIPGMEGPPVGAQPTLWPFPADLRTRALAGSTVAYDLLTTEEGAAAGRDAVTVKDATWGCRIPIAVKQINDTLTLFALQGVDEADRPTLLALRAWLAAGQGAGTVVQVLVLPAPNAGNAAGITVLGGTAEQTFIIQSNLSTESVPRSPDIALGRVRALSRDGDQPAPAASLEDLERFVTLLWEGSVVGGVGYTLGLEAGLPASAIDTNGVASIDLLIIAGSQQALAPEGRTLLPFNTCALIAPGLDATIGTLYAEDHGEEDTILQALVPAGSVGFTLTIDAPPEDAQNGTELQTQRLFSLLGAAIPASGDSPYAMVASGMPAPPTPTEENAPTAWKRERLMRRGLLRDQREAVEAEPYWRYEQILPLYRFATPSPLPRVAGLPSPDADPYRGFGWAEQLPSAVVDLTFQDILGNQTGPAPEGQGQVSLPTGYTDPLMGVGDWPALVSAYAVSKNAGNVSLTLTLDPRPATVMPSPTQAGNAAAQTAERQAEAYAKAYYQLGQPLTAAVQTSLDTSGAHTLDQAPLWRFAAAAQAFSASAAALGSAPAPESATLGSLARDYNLRGVEMALANADTPMEALFGADAKLLVPAFVIFAENDSAALIAGATRPDGWPVISAEALLAAPENGLLPLRSGAVLVVSPPLTRNTADGSANLATLANALGTLPGLLARDNAEAPILAPGFTFSVAVSDATLISVIVTEPDATPPIRSLTQVCAAFAGEGVSVTPMDLGESHQALPSIFEANQIVSSSAWVAGIDDTLADNDSGLSQAALAALNTATLNLFDMGTLLHLGAFNNGAGISADGVQTLHQFADAHACPAELLLNANPDLAVPAAGAFALPGLLAWPQQQALVRIPYTLQSGDSLNAIAPRFDWDGTDAALALATANLEIPALLAANLNLNIVVNGQTYSITTAVNGQSLATTLAQVQVQAPAATLADVVTSIGDNNQALAVGALVICPAALLSGATAPSAIAALLGVSAGAFALANAGTPGLIAVGITLAAPQGSVTVQTRVNDCLNSLIVRFAEAGVQVNAQTIVETPANADQLLFAAGARALVPPAPARISLPIGAQGPYPGPAFPLTVSLTLTRPVALINPDFEPGTGGGVERSESIIPAPQVPAPEDEGGGLAFNAFIAAMRQALPELRVATGRALEDSRDLWAVDFGPAGISALTISGTTSVPGAPGPQPRFFALTPLYKSLVSRQGVDIRSLRPDGTLSTASANMDFQGIDVEPWATRFLSDMDRILGASTAAALFRTPDTRQTLSDLVAIKRTLAGTIPEGLAPILQITDPDAVAGQAAAASTLEQQLGVSLSRAWSASTLVQLNRTVTSPWQTPATDLLPADVYGGISVTGTGSEARSWTMSAAKCWLTDRSPFVTLLLTESDPATHRTVTANMAFGITDLERNITTANLPDGYAASQWLTFVPPLGGDNRPPAVVTDLSEVSVPIPLRAFPALPVIIDQRAMATALDTQTRQGIRARRVLSTGRGESAVSLSSMPLWDHRFSYSHEHAEQDDVSLTLRYNLSPGNLLLFAATEEDLFAQLARYVAVADDLWEILGHLPESGPLSTTQSNAADTFRDLAQAVGDHWAIRFTSNASNDRLQAPVSDEFTFQARVTDRDGSEVGSREIASLTLTAATVGVGPDGNWPEVSALTAVGLGVLLSRTALSATESRYDVPESAHVPASWPTFSLTFVGLNVARWQNATGSILVQRNQKLLGPDGPATNPDFVFQTDRVEAASVATPFNTWDERVALSTTPTTITLALQSAFDTLFGAEASSGGLTVTLGVSYAYELATDPLDPSHGLVGETPVFLYPNQTLDANTAGNLQTAADTWREQANPQRDGGEWVFSLTLYSSLEEDQRPLLSIANLYLPMPLEQEK